jgi:hypothetical protein
MPAATITTTSARTIASVRRDGRPWLCSTFNLSNVVEGGFLRPAR